MLLKQRHTEPAADDSLGKAVHVGTAGICIKHKPVRNEEKKMPQSKYAQKYPYTRSHAHIYVEIFVRLRSAAISSVSVRMLFGDLGFELLIRQLPFGL